MGKGCIIFINLFRSEITTASSAAVEIASQSDLTSCVSERTVVHPSDTEIIESSDHEEQGHGEDISESIPELINSQKSGHTGSQGQERDFRSESNGPTSATSEDTLLSHDEKQRKLEDLRSAANRAEEVVDEALRQLYSSKTNEEAILPGDGVDGKYEKYDKDAFQGWNSENRKFANCAILLLAKN